MPNLLWTPLGAHLQSSTRSNFVVWTPIWVNQNSISCVSTSSSQWYTPIHHLRYFYLVIWDLFQFNPCKTQIHQNSWNLLVSKPITMLCGSYHVISSNSGWLKMSSSDHQHSDRSVANGAGIDISHCLQAWSYAQ